MVFQGFQDLGGDGLGVAVGQCPVVGTEFQGERHALFPGGNTHAPVNVKELDIPQQLSGGLGDDLFRLGYGDGLVADNGQITADRGGTSSP